LDDALDPEALPDPLTYEARLEAVLASITDGFYALDAHWRFVVFNHAAEEFFGVRRDDVLGHTMDEAFPEGRGTYFEMRLKAAMEQGEASDFEIGSRMRPGRTVQLRISPMPGGGVSVVLNDVTERREAEERRRLLVNELNHRVKNTLATVQAIAAQSLHDCPPDTRERFLGRLLALARANDVLVTHDWQDASLAAIAEQVASPWGGRLRTSGPPLSIPPKAAVALALALHELATNAAKYGALSVANGRVDLAWSAEGETFRLAWRESHGPPVSRPVQSGFGDRLIRRGLAAELRGEVTLDFLPTGVVCEVTAPLSSLTAA
jgi:PAS domain S-box-containing protein